MGRRGALPGNLRRFTIALAVCALGGGVLVWLWPDLSGLYLFTLYSMPSNSMLPVPHEPGLFYFAKYYDPMSVAIAGAVGSAVAAFADYEIVERALRHPKLAGARETDLYRWSVKWLMRMPFWTIVLFAATPLPVYVVRVLAPASGYPVWRYVLAIVVGRLPRFWLIAWLGAEISLPTWSIVLMFVLLVALLTWSSRRGASGAAGSRPDEASASEDSAAQTEPEAKTDADIDHQRAAAR